MTIDGRIQELIEDFVTKVTGLAREVALATLHAQMSPGHTAPSSKGTGNTSLLTRTDPGLLARTGPGLTSTAA